jgi:hypothetical protein
MKMVDFYFLKKLRSLACSQLEEAGDFRKFAEKDAKEKNNRKVAYEGFSFMAQFAGSAGRGPRELSYPRRVREASCSCMSA